MSIKPQIPLMIICHMLVRVIDDLSYFRSQSPEKVPKMADNIHDAMRKYGIEKKNEIIWDFFGAIIFFLAIFLVGYGCGSRWTIRFAMFLTFFLTLSLLFMSVVLMILLVSDPE
jgi:hypothetical protein